VYRPASLFSFFGCSDVIQLRGDGEQSPIKALELAASFTVDELASVHLQEVACGRQGLVDAGKVGAGSSRPQ
jgi:hypothetical protein